MTNEEKKMFLEELHLFKTEEANFAFLPTRLLLYQIDSDTYDKLADLVVEKLAAKGISADVVLDDAGIDKIAETVAEKVAQAAIDSGVARISK